MTAFRILVCDEKQGCLTFADVVFSEEEENGFIDSLASNPWSAWAYLDDLDVHSEPDLQGDEGVESVDTAPRTRKRGEPRAHCKARRVR